MIKVSKYHFLKNKEKQNAVIREIEIIGEATKNMSLNFIKKYPDISWRGMTGMRDKIIHHYFGIDLDKIWNVVKYDIPKLKVQIEKILEKENET